MGAVKDDVVGTPAPKKGTSPGSDKMSLINQLNDVKERLSKDISIKETDVNTEGDAARAENMRKVGILRSAFSLVSVAKQTLEHYDTP